MNENSINHESKYIDPVGVELVLSILSLSVGIISAVHHFGIFTNKNKDVAKEFKKLREKVIRLHNCLDDFVLTLQRHSHYEISENEILSNKRLTISETMFKLKDKDYYRWIDIQDSVTTLTQEVYSIVTNIRTICFDYERELSEEAHLEIFSQFDNLLINYSNYELGKFVSELRKTISNLEAEIHRLYNRNRT